MIATWTAFRVFTRVVLRRAFARSSEVADLRKIKASLALQSPALAADSESASADIYTSDKHRMLGSRNELHNSGLDMSEFEHDKKYHSMLKAMVSTKSVFKFVEANKFKLKTTHLVTAIQRLITIYNIEKKRTNLLLHQSAVKLSRANSTFYLPELKMMKDSLWKNPNFTSIVELVHDQLEKLNGEGLLNLAKALRSDISSATPKSKLILAFFKTVSQR